MKAEFSRMPYSERWIPALPAISQANACSPAATGCSIQPPVIRGGQFSIINVTVAESSEADTFALLDMLRDNCLTLSIMSDANRSLDIKAWYRQYQLNNHSFHLYFCKRSRSILGAD